MTTTPELLDYLRTLPGRCWHCGAHIETQGHNGGCLATGERWRDNAIQATTEAHPDDAARVDEVLDRFIASGLPFSANDTRPYLNGIKGGVVGARFRAASQAGRIKRTGDRVPSTDPGTHAHPIDVWRRAE